MRSTKALILFILIAGLALACRLMPVSPAPGGETTEATSPPAITEEVVTQAPEVSETAPDEIPDEITKATAAILERLGGYPCTDSDFTCVELEVPLDHFNPENSQTIPVVFAVLPASGERKGMFVTATGGPGTSGLLSAADYTAAFDERIPEQFDIVFFDQRGVGESGNLQCPQAAARFYQADWSAVTPEQEENLLDAAGSFSQECVQEMGHADWLPYLSTVQAVEDLEVFRQALGVEKFWLYGESYGTQYAQTYAAARPDRLAGLILDGTVDLTLTGPDFLKGQAEAFNAVLVMTLESCNADEACTADYKNEDALATYDDLARRLQQSPLDFNFPLSSGKTEKRSFTFSDLETAAADYLYSESARMILLRSLAAASHDDLVPLARQLYDALGLDPQTLEPVPDPSFSDAVYYAVECIDYNDFSGSPEERALAYLRDGDAIDASLERFASIFYGDLPCAFWPGGGEVLSRPQPLTAEGIPTLVLGATADPATPVDNGVQVYGRLADGRLVTTQGGAHIIFGRGDACPDELVTVFLLEDKLPDESETTCEGVVADEHVPLAPHNSADFADALEALDSAYTEIYYLPEYYYWDLETPTSVGCPYGGALSFEPSDAGESFSLESCAFSEGFVMAGSGEYDYESEAFTLEVEVSGLKKGNLTYEYSADGSIRATGEYGGEAVDLSR